MLLLALAYLVVFTVGFLPDASQEVKEAARFGEYVIVAAFAAELVIKLAVARRKLAFLRSHWLDVIIVVLPFLRPLRFLRFLRFLPLFLRVLYSIRRILGPYHGAYVVLIGLLAVFVCSILVTVFEERADGPIQNVADALWWAIATITTVGYGDVTPVTPEGRAVAAFLMVVGIALFGMLTAAVAAFFVSEETPTEAGEPRGTTNEELLTKLEGLEERLEEQSRILEDLREVPRRSEEHE